jgi:hypothetical protein
MVFASVRMSEAEKKELPYVVFARTRVAVFPPTAKLTMADLP